MRIIQHVCLGVALLSLPAAPALAGGYEEGGGHREGGYSRSASYGGQSYEGGGYHAWGGGVRRSEETASAWRYRRVEDGPRCWREDAPRPYERADLPACGPEEVVLPGSFFIGDGGVGGFPEVMDYGGGGGFAFAGAGAHASAFASASARVSISFRGGGRHHGGGGHKGGCGCH